MNRHEGKKARAKRIARNEKARRRELAGAKAARRSTRIASPHLGAFFDLMAAAGGRHAAQGPGAEERFAGRLNRYTCEQCAGPVVTIDRDEGVTPFMIRCRAKSTVEGGCAGLMRSAFYRDVEGEPEYEWRRPSEAEYGAMSSEMREHIDRGGLQIYPIARPAAVASEEQGARSPGEGSE